MSLKEPIVEGAYYLRENGSVVGPATEDPHWSGYYILSGYCYWCHGTAEPEPELTRRVWITHTDPAEVVAELRERQENVGNDRCWGEEERGKSNGFSEAAELVSARFEVTNEQRQTDRFSPLSTHGDHHSPDLDEVIRGLVRELRLKSELAINGSNGEDRAKAAAYSDAADLVAERLGVTP